MSVQKQLSLLVVLIGALLTAGCRDRSERRDGDEYSKHAETADEDFEHTKTTFSEHMNARLERLDARLRDLGARGSEKARQAAGELRAERDRLAPKVDEIGDHAKQGWDQFETEVSERFNALERRLDEAFDE